MLKGLFILVMLIAPSIALAESFVQGTDYTVISSSELSRKNQSIGGNVTEFFSYGCHWCFTIEPVLAQWIQKQDKKITFNKIPVVFNPIWEYYAKAYYMANALGLSEQLNPVFFKAIVKDKKKLDTNEAMIDFFAAQGVDKAIAQSAFTHSPSIELKVQEGHALMARYRINAIPAFIVNYQYKTDLQMAKTPERLLLILDFLLHKQDQH